MRVPKRLGEEVLVLVNRLKIADNNLMVQRDENFIYVPLISRPTGEQLKTLKERASDCRVSTRFFPERRKREASLAELLEGKLPTRLLASLPHSADFVGDIAIVEISPELDSYRNKIGEAILKVNQNVRTVLAKAGAISGTYRVREFTVAAGEPKTETVHKEYGCQYYVDVARMYFSPRLSYEHNRVACLVKDGETVVDFFAGVGPFAMPIAKNHKNVEVHAIDVNPDAVEYLKRNIRLNRVVGKVHAILGDAREVVGERLSGVADRVIMNLPERAIEFVDAACKSVKPTGGIAHFYGFVNSDGSLESVQRRFAEAVERCGRRVDEVLYSRNVRETAPHEWQVVLDVRIR